MLGAPSDSADDLSPVEDDAKFCLHFDERRHDDDHTSQPAYD